jgi:pyrimidine-nucleoside phosphorylase/thymidine phosphorylase
MKTLEDARRLAATLAGIGRGMGKRVSALLTDMNQPLGRSVGNALEVVESIEILRGGGPADVRALTVELGAEMLLLGGAAASPAEGRAAIEGAIASGRGLDLFRRIVEAQGGDPASVDDPSRLPRSRELLDVPAATAGFVEAIDAEGIGLAAMAMGAGRARVEDRIDPAAGIVLHRKVGERVEQGEPLCTLHGGVGGEPPSRLASRVAAAWRIGPGPAAPPRLIIERIAQ